MSLFRTMTIVGLVAFLNAATSSAHAQCPWQWTPGDGIRGVAGTLAIATFDPDGGSPQPAKLIVGGSFSVAGNIFANRIAAWDGASWSTLGSGMNDYVGALFVIDDGSGPTLFASGNFTTAGGVPANKLARWNGLSWSALGPGQTGGSVSDMVVYDDGNGPAIYADGTLINADGSTISGIGRWNGVSWSPLAGGTPLNVTALAVYDAGSGPELYATGFFTSAGGVPANRIARWSGSGWTAMGSGLSGQGYDLVVHDDGSGAALYVGGDFIFANGQYAYRLARWNGTWSMVGAPGIVHDLCVYDAGGEPELYADGRYRWNGTFWSDLGGFTGVDDMAMFDSGTGPALYVSGQLLNDQNHIGARGIARWNGAAWSALGTGMERPIHALQAFDDGGGPALFAGGEFHAAGNVTGAHYIARRRNNSWSAVGSGTPDVVETLAVAGLGSGPALFAGGEFTEWGCVAKWNGTAWATLGAGVSRNDEFDPRVQGLFGYDDESGARLLVGGQFHAAGGVPTNYVAAWSGGAWSALGGGIGTDVHCFAEFDDGSGPALYAGGYFRISDGAPGNSVARWDGSDWSPLGAGITATGMLPVVFALAVFDDGGGAVLYACGQFNMAGGAPAGYIAKWDGSAWSTLGSGLNNSATSMLVFDEGSGPALYVGGQFTSAGGTPANRIAKWDGTSWSALGSGTSGRINALAVFDDGGGPALYAGGSFSSAGEHVSAFWARWARVCPAHGDVNCDGRVNFFDIDAFLLAVLDAAGYAAAYPECDIAQADVNGDSSIDFFDIDPFVLCLLGTCP